MTDEHKKGLFVRQPSDLSEKSDTKGDADVIAAIGKLRRSVEKLTEVGDESPNPPPFSLPLVFPTSGGLKALPAGDNTFDFETGRATLGNGVVVPLPSIHEVAGIGIDHLLSLHISVDSLAEISFFRHSQQSGFHRLEGPIVETFRAITFDQIVIRVSRPTDVRFVGSARPEGPVDSLPLSIGVNRYSGPTVTATSASPINELNIGFVAVGGGVQEQTLAKKTIYTRGLGTKTFLIVTTSGEADITATLQVLGVDGATWFDDPDTNGATVLTAGNSYVLESSFPCEQMRLQMYVASGSAEPFVQFFGTVESR